MPRMIFIERDGSRREVDAPLGLSVLEVAHRNDIDIEGACEGSLACSTCHVIVDPDWYDLLKEASEDEEDMLDLAFNLSNTSRLGCQIIITEELDGLTVQTPGGDTQFAARLTRRRGHMANRLFSRLVAASPEAWRSYTKHDFVLLLAKGEPAGGLLSALPDPGLLVFDPFRTGLGLGDLQIRHPSRDASGARASCCDP